MTVPDLDIHNIDARRRALPETGMGFATVQGLVNNLDTVPPDYFQYSVFDEFHHFKAETWEAVVRHFDPLFALGLTATPDRMDRRDIRELFGEEVYSKGLAEAIAEGLLANPDYHIMLDDAARAIIEGGFEPETIVELRRLFTMRPRNKEIAKTVLEERRKIGLDKAKTIAFCENRKHADEMAAPSLLGGEAYHSGVKDDEQDRILSAFRTGDIQVISTVNKANEGVDIPDARVLAFLRSTESDAVFQQQLGRGLRRIPGKDTVTVLDYAANLQRILRVRKLIDEIREAEKKIRERKGVGHEEGPEADDTRDESGGMTIHTAHGDFVFDKCSVDLMDAYLKLTEPAPEGWASVGTAATENRVGIPTILRIAEEEGWGDLPMYRFGYSRGKALNPTQREALKTHPYIVKSNETISVERAAKENDSSSLIIVGLAAQMGWQLPTVGARQILSITHHQIDRLREEFPDRFLKPIPPDRKSVSAVAKALRLGKPALEVLIEEKGWELPRHKSRSGQPVDTLSDKEIKILEAGLVPRADDTIWSVKRLAEDLDVQRDLVREAAEVAGIKLTTYKFVTAEAPGIHKKDKPALERALKELQEAAGITLSVAAEELGVARKTVYNQMVRMGWIVQSADGKRTIGVHRLTHEQMDELRRMYENKST